MPDASIRDTLVERLATDLIGPGDGPTEQIDDRPTDRYLTGILYPQRSTVAAEEDEGLGVGGDDASDTGQDGVALPRTMRPSAAGLSFALGGTSRQLRVTITCGRYEQQNESDAPGDGDRASSARRGRVWQRIPLHAEVRLASPCPAVVELAERGIPGLRLVARERNLGAETLITLALVNAWQIDRDEPRASAEAKTFLQVQMVVEAEGDSALVARPSRRTAVDADGRSAALLYRDAHEFAVGHTCSADWIPGPELSSAASISTSWLPSAEVPATSSRGAIEFHQLTAGDGPGPLDAEHLASSGVDIGGLLEELPAAYERWLERQSRRVAALEPGLREQAIAHLTGGCSDALTALREGARLVREDPTVRSAFQMANRAMALQFRWTQEADERLVWRPFQLGFVLSCLPGLVDPRHADRAKVDLLWFPTGGGKTEAYLCLVAFVCFLRRLRANETASGGGTAVLMRYTLRLLTAQQFERAAALILACELLRREDESVRFGPEPFSIGLWVGDSAVANRTAQAIQALNDNGTNRPDQLERCPCCGNRLAWLTERRPQRIRVRCPETSCRLHGFDLPIETVDEQMYQAPPSLLIGTIDKFAQLPRRLEAGGFFGLRTLHRPPDLIIQDELHLISGPLGTIAGLFETAVDALCARDGVHPKVVASTATIRRAEDQAYSLYGRATRLFPPPALDASDSGFAVRDDEVPARRYVAVTTAGRSAKFTLQAVSASLLQSTAPGVVDPDQADAYTTLVAYFNSLRELGGAVVLMQDDVPATIHQYAIRRDEPVREVHLVQELTSRLTQSELGEVLADLQRSTASGEGVDVALATNMISVGIDVGRLGIMVINGQPKTVAEYIQASSRVGRKTDPGLVVAVYNDGKARDRSRFETFRTWHETLYREVEATSVTPFASRARDRGLTAVLVALVRHLVPAMAANPLVSGEEGALREVAEVIRRRVEVIDPEEVHHASQELEDIIHEWLLREDLQHYHDERHAASSLMVSSEYAAARRARGRIGVSAWPVPSSMRSVEPPTRVVVLPGLRAAAATARDD